jgi:hypothetical protein
MKKVLIITPHLSTGGAPQVTLNKIKLIKDEYIIKCVEYNFVAWNYVVQRNQIENILGDNFHSLGDNKFDLLDIVREFNPDIISMEEFPEFFMNDNITKELYKEDRSYTIFETTHDSSFPVTSKKWFPDKFIFVSAFNAFRYSIYDIPYDIVEYPVDQKYKDKGGSQQKLEFDPTYKHVLNVGLFTQRKNQGYIFEIAQRLKDHKIKFHFLGNQADNFKSYWEPLLDNKTDNCMIWGERSDVSTFIEACDLFLFPSKGDKNNKELNPIALKEALEYEIPMMMYNLDVYCGKYDNYDNISFLTGDIETDTNKLVELLNPPVESTDDELIIIGTYPNTKTREQLTLECIESVKHLGRKIMLVTHYPASDEIRKNVDYYVYDENNPKTEHSYYTTFYNHQASYDVEINLNGLKDLNQSFPVLTNLINGFSEAKNLGFNKVFYITYDVILNLNDTNNVNHLFSRLSNRDGYLCTLKTDLGLGIETTSMGFRTDFFLDKFSHIKTTDDYRSECKLLNCHNFLEDFMYNKLYPEPTLEIFSNPQETLLVNSGRGVQSLSEYYSILQTPDPNKWVVYFYSYNNDDREVEIHIMNHTSYQKKFNIKEQKEFIQEFEYRGQEVIININFYEQGEIYSSEKYSLNPSNINNFKNNGYFRLKKPINIKLVHLQTTLNDERERLSRESVQQVEKYGIKYVLHTNEPYTSLPPSHNCVRPFDVRMEKYTDPTSDDYGYALTPSHYGCFESFKIGILSEFDPQLDFLIVCEGDCIIEVPIEEFINKVKEVCQIVDNEDISYFSFGDVKTLDFGWHQSNVVREIPNQDLLFITDKIIGLQCIMFPKKTREYLFEQLRTHKWDCADTYFNIIFSGKNMGILKERITTQADGYSLIDKEVKTFIK